jgi:hypothetical protein
MAITYTWKIDMMHTQSKMGVENAVTEIHWSKTGTDATGSTGRYPGCTKFSLEETAALNATGNFTPLNNLTETQVLTWIQSTITSDDMTFIDSQIQASIDHQKAPKTSTSIDSNSFPWAATN